MEVKTRYPLCGIFWLQEFSEVAQLLSSWVLEFLKTWGDVQDVK